MSITCSMKIPFNKLATFHEILVITNGRYLKNNYYSEYTDEVYVYFEYGDYEKFHELWKTANLNIVEKRSDTLYNNIIRRIKLFFTFKLWNK